MLGIADRRVGKAVLLAALGGLILRIVYALAVAGDRPLVGDGLEIHGIANAVADGRGYVTPVVPAGEAPLPTAHKPPLYPLLLSLVSLAGGEGVAGHQLVTALVGSATVAVLAVLALRLAGPRAAVIAALVAAVFPPFVVADASLRSESLFVLLTGLALLAALRAAERPDPRRTLLLGVLIGLATLARSEGIVLLVLLAVPALRAPSARAWSTRVALATGACLLVLTPWLVRCWVVFDQPVFVSTNSGDLVAGANCDASYFGPHPGGWSFDCALGEPRGNEARSSARLRARGLRYARDHAGRLPAVLVQRALRPWGLYQPGWEVELRARGEGSSRAGDWLGLVSLWLLVPVAVVGGLALRHSRGTLVLLLAPVALVLLTSLAAYGVLRFRAPADLTLIALAAVGADRLLSRASRRLRADPVPGPDAADPPASPA